MNIDIGARVLSNDGREAGRVDRVVVDGASQEVTGIVVHKGLLVHRDILVPVSEIEDARPGEVVLRLPADRLDRLPQFRESAYAVPPPQEIPPWIPPLSYVPGSVIVPLPATLPPVEPEVTVPPAPTPHPEDIVLREGMAVACLDGPCGTVDQVLTDQYTNAVTGFVVKPGGRRGRPIHVPMAWVAEMRSDVIRLACEQHQLEHLPEMPAGPYLATEFGEGAGEVGGGQ